MCGFGGIARAEPTGVGLSVLRPMAEVLRHRGPDGFGFYCGHRVGLAHTRLSIIDPEHAAQPMTSGDGSVVLAYNGEIFNYRELRTELAGAGHDFRTDSDTEVLLEAYRAWGAEMLSRLNGQFAFAVYDRRRERVMLARDRFGIRPLYYARRQDDLVFGSEAKALFASGEVEAAVDPVGLNEVFTTWAARSPHTVFEGVRSLEPGTFALWRPDGFSRHRYYELSYGSGQREDEPDDALEKLDDLLRSSVKLRMRADVPVGSYLSGGLDSTIISRLSAEQSPHQLRTFSVSFADTAYDESSYQRQAVEAVGSDHRVEQIGQHSVAESFPDVVRHVETPLLRTAPTPLFRLSRLTRDSGIKVVLTGEGADELFLGYDIFKETAIRRFCERQPESEWRPRLFDRLYPHQRDEAAGGELWRRFFLQDASPDDPLYSHLPRYRLTGWIHNFFSPELESEAGGSEPLDDLRAATPEDYPDWPLLHRAAWLEMRTFLEPYLLSSQGDRMSLAHGVEARYPFLDHRVFEFAAGLPPRTKLRVLREKHILRRWASDVIPPGLAERRKQPYRAPGVSSFFSEKAPDYVTTLLSEEAVERAGLFHPRAVAGLARRCRSGKATAERENQALVGILSAQIWHRQFIQRSWETTGTSLDPAAADVLITEDDVSPEPPTLEHQKVLS